MIRDIKKRDLTASVLLCLAPILDPYILFSVGSFEVHVVDLLLLFYLLVHLFKHRNIGIRTDLLVILVIMMMSNIITFLSARAGNDFGASIRVWCFWIIFLVLFSSVAQDANGNDFIRCAMTVARIATVLLLIQFVLMLAGVNVWNGQLPFLHLSKTDAWARMRDVSGVIRVHSFFQEPSYYGIYVMPLFAYSLNNKDIVSVVLFGAGLVLSTSSLAIAGIVIILLVWLLLGRKRTVKADHVIIWTLLIVAAAAAFLILYRHSPQVQHLVDYAVSKIAKMGKDLQGTRMGSTKIRLLGNVGLFKEYPLIKKVFGVGINQYPLLYPTVISYSSTMVTLLLNGGIVTSLSYLLLAAKMIFKARGRNKIYGLLFVYVMFTDLCLFTWYAFYLFYWAEVFETDGAEVRTYRLRLA